MKMLRKTSILRSFSTVGFLTVILLQGVIPSSSQDGSFGKDIPLGMAAKQIVPSNYKVEYGPGVDNSKNVSWDKSPDWKTSISVASKSAGYNVNVNGQTVVISSSETKSSRSLTESSRPSPSSAHVRRVHRDVSRRRVRDDVPKDISRSEAHGESIPSSGFVLLNNDQNKGISSSGDSSSGGSLPSNYTFIAESGRNLNSVLKDWASKEGWKVEWKSQYSYTLKASVKLNGDFVSASTELIKSMSDIRPQPTAEFYQGNKVLVVSNNGFDEVGSPE